MTNEYEYEVRALTPETEAAPPCKEADSGAKLKASKVASGIRLGGKQEVEAMKFRGSPRFGGGTYYKLIGAAFEGCPAQPGDAQVEGGGNAARDALLRAADRLTTKAPSLIPRYPSARESPVWSELGRPFQTVDGQWRAAYAHGQSVPITSAERQELQKRHERPEDPTQDRAAIPGRE